MGVAMQAGRRAFLGAVVPAALAILLAENAGLAQAPSRTPVPEPEGPQPNRDPRPLLKSNQKELKREVERLFELAEALKKEVEKTDSAEVLSLSLVRKAEEIEKLAKRIKTLARG